MLTPNAELMRQAREALKGKWGLAVVGNLIFLVVTTVVSAVAQTLPMIGWVANLIVGGPLILGLALFFLGLSRGQDVQYSRIFDGFQRFFDALITYLLLVLLIFLWSLLLVVPGIIAALSYALTFFLMADRPELKGMDALKESQRLMKGNRWKLFCLFLRFIGWFLLGALTMGIGYLWVMPYLQTTAARFYDDVRGGGAGNSGTAGGDGGTRVRPPVPPQPPQQPPRKASPPAEPPKPKPAGPPPAAGPATETPRPPVNPRARLCLSCHSPITDPEAKACPKCGFAIMEVPGFTPKPASPPPPVPPVSAAPQAAPAPPAKPTAPPAPPQAAPQTAPAPSKPLDLEATVRVGPPRLTSEAPDGRPEGFALRLPLNRIGRKNENDLSFPLERTISGRHCEIYQEGKDWFIKDLASTNGVLVNGKKVETAKLQEGDQIKLGNKVFTFTRAA